MSVLVVDDWEFKKANEVEKGMEAAVKYLEKLKNSDVAPELSMWLRSWQDLHRYFHIPVYTDTNAMDHAFKADETKEFAEILYPLITDEGVKQAKCHVILSSGGTVPGIKLGEIRGACVINDFSFSTRGNIRTGMEAAARYVDQLRNRDEVLLSLWARDQQQERRFFHIIAFRDDASSAAARRWRETGEFANVLYQEVDWDSVEQIWTEIVLSTGGNLPYIALNLSY